MKTWVGFDLHFLIRTRPKGWILILSIVLLTDPVMGQCGSQDALAGIWVHQGKTQRALFITDTTWTLIENWYQGMIMTTYAVTFAEREMPEPVLPHCVATLVGPSDRVECVVDHVEVERLFLSGERFDGYYRKPSASDTLIELPDHSGFSSGPDVSTLEQKPGHPEFDTTGTADFERDKGVYALPMADAIPIVLSGNSRYDSTSFKLMLRSDSSDQVRTIANGTVASVVEIPGGSKAVIIKHGLYRSVYADLSAVVVQKGDQLVAGQVLGTSICGETRCEVMFELWKVDNTSNSLKKVDPLGWFGVD